MIVEVLYEIKVWVIGEWDGMVEILIGFFQVKLFILKEFGGVGGDGNNLEELFVLGYVVCFIGVMKFVVGQEKIVLLVDIFIVVMVGIGLWLEGGFGLEVFL